MVNQEQLALQFWKWQEPMVLQHKYGLSIACTNGQLDPWLRPANTPPLQSITPSLHPISIHQMVPPQVR